MNPSDRAWVDSTATLHPTACFTEKLSHANAYERIARKMFIQATGWETPFSVRQGHGWTLREVACGHDVAINKPAELASMLWEAAGG